MNILCFTSAKGGVGKSTVTANLSMALAKAGQRVLTLDLDPQNALRFHQGIPLSVEAGIAPCTLRQTSWLEACFECTPTLYALPYGVVSEEEREAFEEQLSHDESWLNRGLSQMEAALGPDTWVVIDTPPGPSIYMRHALSNAHTVMVVTLPDAASYATLPTMESLIQKYCLPREDFVDYGIIINQLDYSRQLSKDVAQVIRERYGPRIAGLIHRDQYVCEALAYDQSVLDYAPYSQAAQDFIECADAIQANFTLSRISP
ncbi:MAG: cellulose biosynthesis protein BcsQ [Pigmentiphaga sp.]|nr:cellulose biosynthesis protein BcsQ [Pigmentiphaga sp.]